MKTQDKMLKTKVLDKGFIELEEWMGGERAIADAAAICYGRSEWNRDKPLAPLLRKLLRLEHNTPIEHCVFRFRVKCPIFVARQWMRHRIGTFNERSLRYVDAPLEYYVPSEAHPDDEALYIRAMDDSHRLYEEMVARGMPKERARGVLGTAYYTEFIWTVNLWSLTNWLNKRLAKDAQYEHRAYAQAALALIEEIVPNYCEAYYQQNPGMRSLGQGERDGGGS